MVRTESQYIIMPCYAHFTVYKQGIFVCTTDTIQEAEQEIKDHEQNQIEEQKGKLIS